MELLRMPEAMRNKGIKGWPEVLVVSKNEEISEPGLPYIIAETQDYALLFRLMVPLLRTKWKHFDWEEVYYDLTGEAYYPQPIYFRWNEDDDDGPGIEYTGTSQDGTCKTTLEYMASDTASCLDVNMLMELRMIPTFMADVAEAIRINVTEGYRWTDGYNKKSKLCTGYLEEQPQPRTLMILDMSRSMPEGLVAGLLTLLATMVEATSADVIMTGGKSYFFTNEEAKRIDPQEMRCKIPMSNESDMFCDILRTHDMRYDAVISFGDSDSPHLDFDVKDRLKETAMYKVSTVYSFFAGERDRYGRSYEEGTGYANWAMLANPNARIVHNTSWARMFK